MSFEPNVGQSPQRRHGAQTLFFSRGAGYSLELESARARLELDARNSKPASDEKAAAHPSEGGAITLSYLGADPSVNVSGQRMLPGKHNYIPTGDPKTWHSNVPTFEAVEYRHLYPGVDLSFYGNADRLEYDFTVAPAGDAARIKLAIAGTQAVSTDDSGNLVLVSQGRTVRFLKPVAYQTLPSGERRSVDAAYKMDRRRIKSQPVIGFALGDYDHSQPLIIDPVVDYAFYLPATVNGYLYVGASTTDAAGNTYIAGTFPNVLRQYGFVQNGFFVAKFNAAGTKIFDNTFGAAKFPYFGGNINGIAVDSAGKIYIAGEVSGAYGGGLPAVNSYQASAGSPYTNGFMAVLSADGSALTYSTYFGANASVSSIAVDASGNASIVGVITYGTFTSLPIRPNPGAPVPTQPGSVSGFVAKINPSVSGDPSLIYSTFLGVQNISIGSVALAVDSSGDAYVTGNGSGVAYPTTPGAYVYNGRAPNNDVFVTKVNPTGTAFLYSALLGPGVGQAIAVDSSNDVYVTGTVYEDDYPTTSGAYQTSYPSGFVTELNPAGSALVYSTFLGGPSDHLASGASFIVPTHLALPPGCSSACSVYVAGYTNGSDLPLVDPVQSYVPGSAWSGFYMELAGNGGSLLQSSYFASGSGFDPYQQVPGIGVDSSANIYLTGDVLPLDFPVTQTTSGPTGEGFLAKIKPASGAKLSVSPSSITFPTQVVDVSTAQQGFALPTVFLENLGDTAVTLSSIKSSSSVFSQTNDCNGTVAAGGHCTLTLSYTPNAAATQTGMLTFSSTASVNPTVALTGIGTSDRYLVASCGGVGPCPGLSYADTSVGGSATAQIVTLTNYGNTAVAIQSIAGPLPDFGYLSNCPLTGTGLGHGQSCQISIGFAPTQVGLRSTSITITAPGKTANPIVVPVAGTGVLQLSPNPSSLIIVGSMLNFGTVTVGATSATQIVTVFNNGTAPATVFTPTTSTTGDASGASDYVITANNCGSVLPEGSCTITLAFAPTATGTRSGKLTIPTSASSTALTSNLTGIGVATKQTLEFTPDKITFPDQVVGTTSAAIGASVYNVGPTPVYIDRVLVSGSYQLTSDTCSQTTLAIPTLAGADSGCSIQVAFSPTSTGVKTGTVTVVDSVGNQTPLSLAGTGIAQNGMLYISPGEINFGTEPVGTSSGAKQFIVSNIGNIPVTVSAISVTGDYSYSFGQNTSLPVLLRPGGAVSIELVFTPSKVANPDNGTITLTTSAGNYTINLPGVGVAASKAVISSPPPPGSGSLNFGNIQVGKSSYTGYGYEVFLSSQGNEPVKLSATPTISGPNAADFSIQITYCSANAVLEPGVSCYTTINFTPSAAGTRNATLSFTNDATTGGGTQTVSLTGTGTAATPAYILVPATVAFGPQAVSTTSNQTTVSFTNNSTSPVTISTVTISPAGSFTRYLNPYNGNCTQGAVAANGGSCSILLYFAPSTAGAVHGTATLTDSNGNNYVVQLYGYATPIVDSVSVTPLDLNFAPQPQLSNSNQQLAYVYNYSTQPVAIGQLSGKNTIVGTSTTGAFNVNVDGCSNKTVPVNGGSCPLYVLLSPTASTAVGNQSGSITIPVTYADKKTSSASISLTGTVVAPYNSAELSPTVLTFLDQPVNTASGLQSITITNKSNESFTIGTITSTNTSSTGPFKIISGGCQGIALGVGLSCSYNIQFAPTTAGSGIKGTLTFPITFTNGKTTSLTATYSGNALAAKTSLLITPDSANLGPEVVGQAYGGVVFNVTNTGNQPVPISAITLSSTNFTRNGYGYNQCGVGTLNAGATCPIFVEFAPQTTGTINGTLTISDGAASGGPHTIPLVGVGVAATKTIGVSQSAVNFGDVTVGSSGAQEAVYLTNQSAAYVTGFTYTLGGINASDFTLQANNCGATIYAKQTCALLVSFSPAKASLGARSATVTVAFGGSTGSSIGSPITINLQGTGVPPEPNVALFPSSLSYPTQAVGSKSAAQYFRLYNTGSASLSVTAFGSTTAEFSIVSNTCPGKTLTLASNASCLIGVAFSPSAAGTRTGTIQFTDNSKNVVGSTQTVALTGVAVAVPLVTLSPSSLAFGNQNVGTTSATQTVTVSNPGAATLAITSIVKAGSNPGDFAIQANTCGSTLASKATCTLTMQFAPTVAGSRTATIMLTDNADNASGVSQPTQTISLGGTGVGVPAAGVSPSSLSFGSGTVGTPSAAMNVTLKNSGTGALVIASIAFTGTDPTDFAETNGCGTSLAAGAQCSIAVTFDAKAAGARTANLVVTDNSGLVTGSTQTVGLSGTGVQ